MTTEAFVIIDVQNDFCPGGALAVPGGDEVVPIINALQEKFTLRVLTQDWHPADHSSFASNHENSEPYSMITMPYGEQILWPTHCVQGTPGARFHEGLSTDRAAMIVRKGFRSKIDSYSAFFENDHKTPTGLTGYLREVGVETVTLAGLATDFCVRYSAVDAAKLGFQVTLIEDACRAIDLNGSLDEAMRDMSAHGIQHKRSGDLLS